MQITGVELVPVQTAREMGRRKPADMEKARSNHVIVRLHTDAEIYGLGEMSDVNWSVTPVALSALRDRLEAVLVEGACAVCGRQLFGCGDCGCGTTQVWTSSDWSFRAWASP